MIKLYWFVRYDSVAVATTVVVILVVMIVVLRSGRIGCGCGVAEFTVARAGRIDNVLFLREKVSGLGFNMVKWVGLQ
jgi:hypothetical protein